MNSTSRFAALVAVAAVSSAASAAVIDDFTTTSVLVKSGVGAVTQTTISGGALGGSRFESVAIAAGGGGANLKINSPLTGIAALSSETGVDALYGLTYGNVADLNADFSINDAFIVRLKKTDIGAANNMITVTTTGIGSASASFAVPDLVALGGPAGPFDVVVHFASFSGAAVDFSDIDKVAYSFNPPNSADWQIQLLGTASVPEPSAIGLLVASAGMLLARRRRA